MVGTRHALPLNKDHSLLFFDSDSNDNIVIIIPKPDLVAENNGVKSHLKFHTVSCFQDIIEEEEDKDLDDDPLMLFYDENGYTDKEEDGVNSTFYGLLDFLYAVKDTFNSMWNFPWTAWETKQSINQNDLRLHLHFDV
ncbi:unnamed protein product [Mucor hiemalis]